MKKSLIVLFASASSLFVLTFGLLSLTVNEKSKNTSSSFGKTVLIKTDLSLVKQDENELTFTHQEVWDHFDEKIVVQLNQFFSYDEKRSFSRCPSGLGQIFNEEESYANIAFGQVVFWSGCSNKNYCFYKVDMKRRTTFLKLEKDDAFVSMEKFVENQIEKEIAKN